MLTVPPLRVVGVASAAAPVIVLASAGTPEATSPPESTNLIAQFASDKVYEAVMHVAPQQYGGLRIKRSGDVEVSLVGKPSPALRSAVDAAVTHVVGVGPHRFKSPLRVSYRRVANTEQSLIDLTMRLANESDRWVAQGIVFTHWGPDYYINKVELRLKLYTPKAEAKLEKSYGTRRLYVSPVSTPPFYRP